MCTSHALQCSFVPPPATVVAALEARHAASRWLGGPARCLTLLSRAGEPGVRFMKKRAQRALECDMEACS